MSLTWAISMEHSVLWSALRTLELTRQFILAHVEASKAYRTNVPVKFLAMQTVTRPFISAIGCYISKTPSDFTNLFHIFTTCSYL